MDHRVKRARIMILLVLYDGRMNTTYSVLTSSSDSTRIALVMVDNDKEPRKYFIDNCNQGNYNLERYCDDGGYAGLYGACLAYASLVYGGGCGIPVELIGYGTCWFGRFA